MPGLAESKNIVLMSRSTCAVNPIATIPLEVLGQTPKSSSFTIGSSANANVNKSSLTPIEISPVNIDTLSLPFSRTYNWLKPPLVSKPIISPDVVACTFNTPG